LALVAPNEAMTVAGLAVAIPDLILIAGRFRPVIRI